MTAHGYSGTPLAKKLGIVEGMAVAALHAPEGYRDWLAPLPADVAFRRQVGPGTGLVHLFATRRELLERELARRRTAIPSPSPSPRPSTASRSQAGRAPRCRSNSAPGG